MRGALGRADSLLKNVGLDWALRSDSQHKRGKWHRGAVRPPGQARLCLFGKGPFIILQIVSVWGSGEGRHVAEGKSCSLRGRIHEGNKK